MELVAGVGRSRELPHFGDPLDLANAEAGCMRSEFVHGPIYGSLRVSTMRYIRPTRWVGDIGTEPAPATQKSPGNP
jgi:hypothetical protein